MLFGYTKYKIFPFVNKYLFSHHKDNGKPIRCTWSGGHFISQLIYKHPRYNEPYDVALIDAAAGQCIPDHYFTTCSQKGPTIGKSDFFFKYLFLIHDTHGALGQLIYSVGFPHFIELGKYADNGFSPSIFDGRITKIDEGRFLTDASVQAGNILI